MIVGNEWLLAISLLAIGVIGASYLFYRRRVSTGGVLRFLAAACIVASFGGIALELVREVPLAVYALDVSESYATSRLSAVEAIRTHAAEMRPASQASLVTFSSSAALESPVGSDAFTVGADTGAGLGKNATNIEESLKAVAALEGRTDRVYLFSDGRANRGNMDEGALLCSQAGIKIFPVVLNMPNPADAWVDRVEVPEGVSTLQRVKLIVRAGSNNAGKFTVSLAVGANRMAKRVESSGEGFSRRVAFDVIFREPGIVPLVAQISTADFSDSYPPNNLARGAVRVLGPPRVLVCSTRAASAAGRLLGESDRFSVVPVLPEEVPLTLGSLQDVAAIVLDNVPAVTKQVRQNGSGLSTGQMILLKRYVRDLGGGIIVLGGPDSFGPGGYIETPLEEVLPVWCNPEKRKKISLVFALDASGSMGQQTNFLGERMTKFRAALKAIMPVCSELKEGDKVAVVTFNTQPALEMPLNVDDEGKLLRDTLRSLAGKRPGGKTNIYPALQEALKLLEAEDIEERKQRKRHVILLSDGRQTVEDTINIGQFKDAGVSVSAVATGAAPDRTRLKKLAEATNGRYYEVAEFDTTLPEVFVGEIRKLSELERTGRTRVDIIEPAEFLKGIDVLPDLAGMVLTEGKDEAHVVARSDKGEPVLAWWRLGLGRAVAFSGALDDDWGGAWLEWDGLGKLLSQAVRWSGTDRHNPDFRLKAHADGLTVHANLLARSEGALADGLNLKAVFSCGDTETFNTELVQVGPGEYEAEAPGVPDSLCAVTVYRETGEILASAEVWVAGSLEFGPLGPDTEALSRLASLTGGEILGEEAFLSDVPEGRGGERYDMWWVLLILAGCFFLADIAQASLFSARRLK